MMLLSKLLAVLRDPWMASAYIHWLYCRFALGRSPKLELASGGAIGQWISFSEFWTFRDGIPEAERLYAQKSLMKAPGVNSISFDIGANLGLFSCFLASQSTSLHAFEPVPDTFVRLKRNIIQNGWIDRTKLNCLGVGENLGLVSFSINDSSPATNRLSNNNVISSEQRIAIINLDQYCEILNIEQIDFLKIDVEGMEPYVLRGARALLKRKAVKNILIEICPHNLRSVGTSIDMLIDEIDAIGYEPYRIDRHGNPSIKLSNLDMRDTELANVALVPHA